MGRAPAIVARRHGCVYGCTCPVLFVGTLSVVESCAREVLCVSHTLRTRRGDSLSVESDVKW
jgi:hypothetical protein